LFAQTTFVVNVAAVADTPNVTGATTFVNQQTTSGLVISRNAADGSEVTHYRITNITNGTLYQTNGTTVIASGSFITAAQGAAGLKFTPALNSASDGSFQVQAATGATVGQLGGSLVTATIDVVNTAPTTIGIPNITVAENAPNSPVNLWAAFADAEQTDAQLSYSIQSNTKPSLFTSTNINSGTGILTLDYASSGVGTANITVRATDPAGAFVQTTFSVTVVFPGDYNRNAIVDAADYVLWRKTLGASGLPAYSGADGDGDSTIDPGDYTVWRANFGDTAPPGAGSGASQAGSSSAAQEKPADTAAVLAVERIDNLPRATTRPRIARGAILSELNIDHLLMTLARSRDDESEPQSALREVRRDEAIPQVTAIDDVFNDLGREPQRFWHF
jgi:hypothetical protein